MSGTDECRRRALRALTLVVSSATLFTVMLGGAAAAQAAGPDPVGTIYVADYAANAIDVFAPGANGNVAPIRQIVGAATGVAGPADVAVDSAGDVYSSNFNNSTITVYAPGAGGNATPIRTIGGANTQLNFNDDISVTPDGTLFAGNGGGGTSVVIFAPGANGNVAPVRTVSGSNTGLGGVDGLGADATGTLYADAGSAIQAFAPGANGNVAPIKTITGSNTKLCSADDVKVGFLGQLAVSDGCNQVLVFAPGANGNVAPTQQIIGSNTGLTTVDDLALDAAGNIYVTNFNATGVVEFASNANGNVAPIAHITGSNTTLAEPEGVAIATPTSNLTLTTSSTGSISIGEPTQDTATLSGGNSPTGALVFNLYGPGDPTCTAAPAFTSAPVPVSGNGSYSSPTFTPTALGNYSWVAEYSGDVNNPPETTACNDQAEQVSVAVADPAIKVAGAGAFNATEGKSFTGAVATFTDSDSSGKASEYSASINWGDGTISTGTISGSPTKFSVSGTHAYPEEGTFAIKVTITDTDNKPNKATGSSSAKVGDAALSAKRTRPSSSGATAKGTVATFTDADSKGQASDYTAQINWGDGSTSLGVVSAGGGKFAVSGRHKYARSGTYTIKTTIKDAGGSTATAKTSVTMQVQGANVSAKLTSVPSACVSSAFNVRVKGTRIASVSFTLDGSRIRGRTIRRGKQYSARISLSPGRHNLTVRVKFRSGSAARSRTFRRIVRGCAPPPAFTG